MASLLTLARGVGDNADNTCTVLVPHHADCVHEVDLQIIRCLAFTGCVMDLDGVNLWELLHKIAQIVG